MLKRSPPSGVCTAAVRHSDGRFEELLAKLLGRPDLSRLDDRLDARRAQDRIAADDDGAQVAVAAVESAPSP